MNDKPTLEELEAAYRRYIERVDQTARDLEPEAMPARRRWELQESVPSWRAAETAKVVSSFGMRRVEAYNMAGERVADIKVPEGSLSATLDVRRWPQGAYILHIHTPQGVASKKLAVKR